MSCLGVERLGGLGMTLVLRPGDLYILIYSSFSRAVLGGICVTWSAVGQPERCGTAGWLHSTGLGTQGPAEP